MSVLGKTLLAASARRNAPARFGAIEEKLQGEYDVYLGDILEGESYSDGFGTATTKLQNQFIETRKASVNYSTDGLTYYITFTNDRGQYTSYPGATWYINHLTLSQAHNLKTVTNQTRYTWTPPGSFSDTSDTDSGAKRHIAGNPTARLQWFNGGYDCYIVGNTDDDATTTRFARMYHYRVTVPYTDTGIVLQSSTDDYRIQETSQIEWYNDGERAWIFNIGQPDCHFIPSTPWELDLLHANKGTYDGGGAFQYQDQYPDTVGPVTQSVIPYANNGDYNLRPARVWIGGGSVFTMDSTDGQSSGYVLRQFGSTSTMQGALPHAATGTEAPPVNVFTMSTYNENYFTAGDPGDITDFGFGDNGNYFYYLHDQGTGPLLRQINLNVPYALQLNLLSAASTMVLGTTPNASLGLSSDPACFCFNTNTVTSDGGTTTHAPGTRLYIISCPSQSNWRLYVFTLTTAYDISTASYSNNYSFPDQDSNMTPYIPQRIAGYQKWRSTMWCPPVAEDGSGNNTEALLLYHYVYRTSSTQSSYKAFHSYYLTNQSGTWGIDEESNIDTIAENAKSTVYSGTPPTNLKINEDEAFGENESLLYSFCDAIGEPDNNIASREGVLINSYARKLHRYAVDYTVVSGATPQHSVDMRQYRIGTQRLLSAHSPDPTSGSTVYGASYYVGRTLDVAVDNHTVLGNPRMNIFKLLEEVQAPENDTDLNRYASGNARRVSSVGDVQKLETTIYGGIYDDGVRINNVNQPEYSTGFAYTPRAFFFVPETNVHPARLGMMDYKGYFTFVSIGNASSAKESHYNGRTAIDNSQNGGTSNVSRNKNSGVLLESDVREKAQAAIATYYNLGNRRAGFKDFTFDPTGHVFSVIMDLNGVTTTTTYQRHYLLTFNAAKPFDISPSNLTLIDHYWSLAQYGVEMGNNYMYFGNGINLISNGIAKVETTMESLRAGNGIPVFNVTTSTAWNYITGTVRGFRVSPDESKCFVFGESTGSTRYMRLNFYDLDGGANSTDAPVLSNPRMAVFQKSGNIYNYPDRTTGTIQPIEEEVCWYDWTNGLLYFVKEDHSDIQTDRAGCQVMRWKLLDPNYDWIGTDSMLFGEETQISVFPTIPRQPVIFKIYNNTVMYVDTNLNALVASRLR